MSERWEPGTVVALRYITRQGAPGMAWPCRVVADRDDLLALFIARGATYKRWGTDEVGQRALVDGTWRRDVLRLMFPGASHSVWLFWEYDPERRFTAYYINMEEPFRRTSIGVDTNDHVLDVVVAPDFSWRWKDEDDLAARVTDGIYSAEFAGEVRRGAQAMIDRLERRESPFSDGWETWEPDPSWTTPEIPEGWATVPPVLWEQREWAYLD